MVRQLMAMSAFLFYLVVLSLFWQQVLLYELIQCTNKQLTKEICTFKSVTFPRYSQ